MVVISLSKFKEDLYLVNCIRNLQDGPKFYNSVYFAIKNALQVQPLFISWNLVNYHSLWISKIGRFYYFGSLGWNPWNFQSGWDVLMKRRMQEII